MRTDDRDGIILSAQRDIRTSLVAEASDIRPLGAYDLSAQSS